MPVDLQSEDLADVMIQNSFYWLPLDKITGKQ